MPLVTNVIQNSAGKDLLVNGYPRQPGQVIEYLSSICDGSTMSGASGSYPTANVTTQQVITTVNTEIFGSSITYTPPVGATRVIYRFEFDSYWASDTPQSINHYRFYIGGTEVIYARHNRSAQYYEYRTVFEWPIAIGGEANTNTGRQTTWATPLQLVMYARRYAINNAPATSNGQNLNGTTYWDGLASNQFGIPQITVIAIA